MGVGRHGGRFGGVTVSAAGTAGRDGMGGEDRCAPAHAGAGRLAALALALIAEQPRHGYEIIKLVEEKTADWYSPSPGIVYPTLTYLEEAGYVTASTEGAKKLYTITDEGGAYLRSKSRRRRRRARAAGRIGETCRPLAPRQSQANARKRTAAARRCRNQASARDRRQKAR